LKWVLVAAAAYFLFPWVQRTIARGKGRSVGRPARAATPKPATQNARSPRDILGVSANASDEEIRRAFRKLAREVHPDAVATSSPEKRAVAERRFREINDAFNTLSTKR